MARSIASIFIPTDFLEQKQKNNSLNLIYVDWEQQKKFFSERIQEADDVVEMLSQRVQSELAYAMRLDRISQMPQNKFMADHSKTTSLKDSAISEEIASFKGSCYSKAKQATELADNVQQSCVLPLQ